MKKSVSSNKQVKKGADTGISIDGYIDYNAFNEARERIIGKAHNDKGIGTLSERHCMLFLRIITSRMKISTRWL